MGSKVRQKLAKATTAETIAAKPPQGITAGKYCYEPPLKATAETAAKEFFSKKSANVDITITLDSYREGKPHERYI